MCVQERVCVCVTEFSCRFVLFKRKRCLIQPRLVSNSILLPPPPNSWGSRHAAPKPGYHCETCNLQIYKSDPGPFKEYIYCVCVFVIHKTCNLQFKFWNIIYKSDSVPLKEYIYILYRLYILPMYGIFACRNITRACNQSLREAEAGTLRWVSGHPGLQSETDFQKKKNWHMRQQCFALLFYLEIAE